MINKLCTLFITIAIIGAFMGVVIADTEKAIDNETPEINKSLMYVGWSWTYGNNSGRSMGWIPGLHSSNPPHDFTSNTTFIIDQPKLVYDDTPIDVIYDFDYTYINLDTWNYTSGYTIPSSITTLVENFDGNLLIVDMFYSDIMNARQPAFVAATENSGAAYKASIFSENYSTGVSYAPEDFQVRDTIEESLNSTQDIIPGNVAFKTAFFYGLDYSGATSIEATWGDFMEIMKYVAPVI